MEENTSDISWKEFLLFLFTVHIVSWLVLPCFWTRNLSDSSKLNWNALCFAPSGYDKKCHLFQFIQQHLLHKKKVWTAKKKTILTVSFWRKIGEVYCMKMWQTVEKTGKGCICHRKLEQNNWHDGKVATPASKFVLINGFSKYCWNHFPNDPFNGSVNLLEFFDKLAWNLFHNWHL